MSNKKIINTLLSKGLASRVRTIVGTIQSTDSSSYVTATDVAYEMMMRSHPHSSFSADEFAELTVGVANALHALSKNTSTDPVLKTTARISPGEKVCKAFPGRKSSFGFRIGVPLVPVMNKDIHKENKVLAKTAEEIQRDPLPTIKSLLDGLQTKHLSDVIQYALECKDRIYFAKNSEAHKLAIKLNEVTEMPPIAVNDLGVRKLSKAELDIIAVQQAGVVGVLKEGVRDESVTKETLLGGWQVIWVNTTQDGSGKLVLKSTNDRTNTLLRKGTLPLWVKDGLNDAQALALWNSHYPYKHTLAPFAGEVLSNPELTEVWLTHPREFGKGTRRSQWTAKHGDSLGLPLSAQMETTLAMVVYDLVDITK